MYDKLQYFQLLAWNANRVTKSLVLTSFTVSTFNAFRFTFCSKQDKNLATWVTGRPE